MFAAMFVAAVTLSLPEDPHVSVESRNMPTHCEFVFQVFSEIEVTWIGTLEPPTTMEYEFFHEYDDAWSDSHVASVACEGLDDQTRCITTVHLESMSTSSRFLYRMKRFRFLNEAGILISPEYVTNFGREFGERCYNDPDATPFRSREVWIP